MTMEKLDALTKRVEDVEGRNFRATPRRGTIPVGGIILWSGAVARVPTGWALCDGNNGTPDLTDRFVIGAGATYAVADTGGGLTSDHGFTQPATHAAHGTNLTAVQAGAGTNITEFNGSNEANHAAHAGGAVTGSHSLPPYYALAYIMRTG